MTTEEMKARIDAMRSRMTHDDAISGVRALTTQPAGEGAINYVCDMADAAQRLEELLFAASGSSSYERWSTDFRKQVEAALAALPKEPK